jgi:hypothetical protein
MRLLCIILSFTLLLSGCYSQQATRVVLDDRDIVFRLNDGSFIKAEPGAHHRALGGYVGLLLMLFLVSSGIHMGGN